MQPVNDAIKCRTFPQTSRGMAQQWYNYLPPSQNGSFEDLDKTFINQFISGRVYEKSTVSLINLEQGKSESLRAYLKPIKENPDSPKFGREGSSDCPAIRCYHMN